MRVLTGPSEIVPAEWDSAFFGLRIGRLVPDAQEGTDLDAVARLDRSHFDCVWIDLDVASSHLLDRWSALGARMVDARVEFTRPLDQADASIGPLDVEAVTRWSDGDRAAVTALAVEQSGWSRLARDPAFAGSVERLYETWVTKAFTGEHQAFVRREAGAVVGMLTGKQDGDVAWIELLDVDAEHRGRGIGAALVREFLERARAEGRREARVRTQLRNLPAIRTYERAGFTLDRVTLVLHWWSAGVRRRGAPAAR